MKKLFLLMIGLTAIFGAAMMTVSCSKTVKENESFYTVTFDTDGGTPSVPSQRVEPGDLAIPPATNPEKQGYVFMFWHLRGASTAYDFQTPVNSNITLIAQWENEANFPYAEYFGTWRTGGSWEQVTISADKIEWYDQIGEHCTISGLTWTETENPGGDNVADYPAGYKVTGTFEMFSSDSYKFLDNNGVPKADGSGNCNKKGDIALNTFYISADKKSIVKGNWSTAEQEATSVKYNKRTDIEFWQITYILNGGEWMAESHVLTKVPNGYSLDAKPNLAKGDLVFEGWYKDAALTSRIPVIEVTENITLYAKWSSETFLQKAAYSMGYSIQISDLVAGGQKPTAINGVLTVNYAGTSQTLVSANITGNSTYVLFYAESGRRRPEVISRGSLTASYLRDGTYNYARNPSYPIAFFLPYNYLSSTNFFVSLSNLQKITNNYAITQTMYDNMTATISPTYSYKVIVFGINNKKELMGKYIGFTRQSFDGILFYYCIDPESPDFGKGASQMNFPQ